MVFGRWRGHFIATRHASRRCPALCGSSTEARYLLQSARGRYRLRRAEPKQSNRRAVHHCLHALTTTTDTLGPSTRQRFCLYIQLGAFVPDSQVLSVYPTAWTGFLHLDSRTLLTRASLTLPTCNAAPYSNRVGTVLTAGWHQSVSSVRTLPTSGERRARRPLGASSALLAVAGTRFLLGA